MGLAASSAAQGRILRRGGAPGPGPLDGPGLQVIPPAVQEALHGGGEHLEIIAVQIGVEGRRVQPKEPLEQIIRLTGKRKGKALGQVDLVNVALGDVFPDAAEGLQIRLPGKVAPGRADPVGAQGIAGGPDVVSRRGSATPPRVLVSNTHLPKASGPAVVHHQTPGKGQDQLRQAQVVHRGLGQVLQMVFQVIGQKPQAPGAKGRQRRRPPAIPGPPAGH